MSERPDGVIYDIGYRHYAGPRLGERYILRSLFVDSLRGAYGLGRAARTKVVPFILLAGVCTPALITVTILNATGGTSLPVGYSEYFSIMSSVITLFVAAQAPASVSRDLRYRVMSLYLSRPLSRVGYVGAKFLALTAALFILTALPLLILFGGALLGGLAPWAQLRDLAEGLVGVLVLSFVLAGFGLLIASITPKRGLGVAAIVTVVILITAAATILQALGAESQNGVLEHYAGLLSPFTLSDGVQVTLFGVKSGMSLPALGALAGAVYLLVALAFVAGAFGLLILRYRRVSVS